MHFAHSSDTIAALATPAGQGGVAVLRISGPRAPEILGKIFKRSSWQSHRLYHGKVTTPEGELLDEGLVVWMKAPRSYTGEDVVELHLHGGPRIAQRALETLQGLGVRPARPGEFTERAFLNGKMDLTQAEAVADMIAAQSDRALKLAQAQWQGGLSGPVSRLRESLLELLVNLEAAVDFPEEDLEILDRPAVEGLLEESIGRMDQWINDYERGRMIREGLQVVLVGRPNVGKSSLLNRLAREEAAIVHPEPGTTRDAVERTLHLGGLCIRLIDTAGIREAQGEVERVGIERSHLWFEKADLVLALFDGSVPLEEEDGRIASLASKKKGLFLFNKTDLPPVWDPEDLGKRWDFVFGEDGARPCWIKVSSKTGEGVDLLEKKIPSLFGIAELEKGDHLLLNQLRHKTALEEARRCLQSAREAFHRQSSPELLAADVHGAVSHLGEIVGEVTTEHILENIFNRFCIGK